MVLPSWHPCPTGPPSSTAPRSSSPGAPAPSARRSSRRSSRNHDPKRVVVFSRDELKQYEVRQHVRRRPAPALVHRRHPGPPPPQPRHARRRLRRARGRAQAGRHRGVQPVGVRRRPTSSARRTSSRPRIDAGVKKVVALSTDKASSPINLYGATKLAADKLFVTGNHYAAAYPTRFSRRPLRQRHGQPRLGHPVLPPARRTRASRLPITDLRMTRFLITLPQAVQFVIDSFEQMQGGELYVPRIPSMKIVDLAQAVAPGADDARDRHAAGREAARGDDLPRGRPPQRCASATATSLQPDLASLGLHAPRRRRARCPTASTTRRTTTTSGSPSSRLRRSSSRRTSERAPLRPPVGRRRRRRGRRRGAPQ